MTLKDSIKAWAPPVLRKGVKRLRRRQREHAALKAKNDIAREAPLLHQRLLAEHRGARPIRVAFLMSNTASWKVGPVFAQMLQDPDFEPLAVICPTANGLLASAPQQSAELARIYLKENGFPYIDMTWLDEAQSRAEIAKFDPHLAFFTNPHSLVPPYLHEEILKSRLSCYVPYNHEVMTYSDNQEQHNQFSHNAFWLIFVPHHESKAFYRTTRLRGDEGVIVTGFPACETLLQPVAARDPSPWKSQVREKKRVIYAPHWLWRPDIKMATIDTFGDAIRLLAEKYRDEVQWALRPHPMLKPRLLEEPAWGPERTANFFDFWQNSDFCQIHEEDYVPLFQTSDAIIHDSGSFLAEYLYLQKPAMYLMTEDTGGRYFNAFGQRAITGCEVGRSVGDIDRFLDQLFRGETPAATASRFFAEDIAPHFDPLPSSKICSEIKRAFS